MHKFLCLLIGLVFLGSCNSDLVFSEYKSTTAATWDKDEAVTFEFNAPDTLNQHHLFINIRNDNQYPYSNLFLIASLNFPDGTTFRDTLEYVMARPDGSWMGEGAGSVKENKLWYKENIIFPFKGVYTLELVHAMRRNGSVDGVQSLPGITDVGLEIEKATNN